jgi:hypothetical protein
MIRSPLTHFEFMHYSQITWRTTAFHDIFPYYFSTTFLILRTWKAAPCAAPPLLHPAVSLPPPMYFTHPPPIP